MQWQDLVFSIGNFVFAFALIPTIKGKDKPAFSTSIISASFLTLFIIAFSTLGLWFSALGVGTSATAWWILTLQTYKRKK